MRIRPIRSFVWYSRTTRQRNGTLHARYIYGDMYLNVFSSGTFDFFSQAYANVFCRRTVTKKLYFMVCLVMDSTLSSTYTTIFRKQSTKYYENLDTFWRLFQILQWAYFHSWMCKIST